MGRVARYKKEKKVGEGRVGAPRKNRKLQKHSHGSDTFGVSDVMTADGDTGEGMARRLPATMFRIPEGVDDDMRHMIHQTASIGRVLDGDEFVGGKEARRRKKKNWLSNKKKRKKQKGKEQQQEEDNRNNSEGKEGSDPVRFGEVANEPPRLDDDPSSLKKRKGKGNNTSNKKKNAATDEEKNAMEKERLRVIEAYRQIKMRKMRG
eukprot:m.16520 g.16520  ORF g.16520 m.16520 type:complete len:206 (+) comp8012_c0_seq2:34-651(+)